MDKPTERAPMLSDERLGRIDWKHVTGEKAMRNVAEGIRDFYEKLITSGELRVVKKVVLILRHKLSDGDAFTCPECEEHLNGWVDIVGGKHGPTESYCPGCGSEIVEDPIPSPPKGT